MTIRASAFSLTHRPIRPSARSSPRLRSASVFRRHGYAPSCARKSFGAVHAISPKGAMGLMQIMPATWAGLRQRYRLGADPYDAHDNIIAGAPFCASCTTAMAFPASSRPTTQVQRAGKITSRPAGGYPWRRRRTLPASLRSSAAMRPTMRFRSPPSSVPGPRRPCLSRVRSVADRRSTCNRAAVAASTNDRRLKDLTGLVQQSEGLFEALSLKGRLQ